MQELYTGINTGDCTVLEIQEIQNSEEIKDS